MKSSGNIRGAPKLGVSPQTSQTPVACHMEPSLLREKEVPCEVKL